MATAPLLVSVHLLEQLTEFKETLKFASLL